MGSWGTGIFQDDFAMDVRDTYTDMLKDGLSDNEALQKTLKHFGVRKDIEESTLWIALALTQHALGRLDASVREKAIVYVDSGKALAHLVALTEKGEDDTTTKSRAKVLQKAKEKLHTPEAKRKTLKWPKQYYRPLVTYPWQVGGMYGYRTSSNHYLIFQVVEVYKNPHIRDPRYKDEAFKGDPSIVLADYKELQLPEPSVLKRLKPKFFRVHGKKESSSQFPELGKIEYEIFTPVIVPTLADHSQVFPQERISDLGCVLPILYTHNSQMGITWEGLEKYISENYHF